MVRRFKDVTGFLLAGGASRRMGRPKAALMLDGETMLSRQIRLLSAVSGRVFIVGKKESRVRSQESGGRQEQNGESGITILADELPGRGPLAGIATALERTRTDFNLVLGCDLPWINPAFLHFLCRRAFAGRADVTLPVSLVCRDQPLCAVYRRRALWAIRSTLAAGLGKATRPFPKLRVERIAWPEIARAGFPARIFDNMNTPEDYLAALRRLSTIAASRIERREEPSSLPMLQ